MYGAALINPTKYLSRALSVPILSALGNDKFAPFEPVSDYQREKISFWMVQYSPKDEI
jgi:hypothetical protein